MAENLHDPAEMNAALQEEVKKLKTEAKRSERELRMTKGLLDKITKSMEAKDALGRMLSATNAKQRAYTEILLGNCPDIILLLDNEGHFVLSTQKLLTLTKTHNFDMIKNKHYTSVLSKYLDEETLETIAEGIRTVHLSHEPVSLGAWIDFSEQGEPRYFSIELRGIEADKSRDADLTEGILAVFTDLTDFMREKQRAEDANRAKSDFLASMSHEIRTPMHAILGLSEMLKRSELNEEQRKHLSDIRKSAHSLLTIINDILDFSKIEAGRMELVNTNYKLMSLLDGIRSMFSHLMKTKGLTFVCELDENLPGNVYGDENRLRQILINLMSNALKYTNEGTVTFRAWVTEEHTLSFAIAASGIGIRKEDQSKLFKPFEQLDVRKNKNVIGTGLGLAITHNLCKLMGGSLWLESEYGKGSTFFVDLPLQESTENLEEEEFMEESFTAPEARMLVVDDMEINLAVTEAMLGIFGIKPDLADSGAKAIKLAARKKYDLIFMDHMMPIMDGLETTQFIREHKGPNQKTPIVALTANAVSGMEDLFLNNGFEELLPKPLELVALNLCLRRWLPEKKIRKGK